MTKTLLILLLLCSCVYAEQLNWQEEAGFISSNFPDETSEGKSQILLGMMKEHNYEPIMEVKRYYHDVTIIYDQQGKQLWPVSGKPHKGWKEITRRKK